MRFGFKRGHGLHRRGRRRKGDNIIGRMHNCICPKCGHTIHHQPGSPCFRTQCPMCGSPMVKSF